MAGLFGGGLQRIRRQAGYLAPRIQREEERTTPAPIVQGTQARTRDEAQMGGLIGGSYKSPRAQGWWNEIMADPFTALLAGRNGLDRKYEAQAAEDEARRMAPILAAMTPEQQAVYNANPGKWGEFMAQNFAPQKVTAGDTLIMRGDTSKPFFAPKVGMDGGVPYAQTYGANGLNTRYGPRRPSTPEEIIKQQEARRPRIDNTGQAITATSFGEDGTPTTRVLHRDPQQSGSQSRFRPATREEAGRYGAEAGQIDDATGRFYPSGGQNAGEFSATERKGFRDKAAAINSLKYLVDEYRKVVNLYGPQLVDSEWDGGLGMRKTNRAQELLAAHNNLMMFLKGPELFNLGVLTGPDVERLQRTLPEPVGAGTIGANKETLAVGLDGLESLINQRLGLIPEQFRTMDAGQTAAPSLTPDEEAELEALRAELGMQ
jgi:hypothetical protein